MDIELTNIQVLTFVLACVGSYEIGRKIGKALRTFVKGTPS